MSAVASQSLGPLLGLRKLRPIHVVRVRKFGGSTQANSYFRGTFFDPLKSQAVPALPAVLALQDAMEPRRVLLNACGGYVAYVIHQMLTISYHSVPYRTVPCSIVPYHTVPCRAVPYSTMLGYAMLCYAMPISYYMISYSIIWHYITLCYIMIRHDIS